MSRADSLSTAPVPTPKHCPPGYTAYWSADNNMFFFHNPTDGHKAWERDYDHVTQRFRVSSLCFALSPVAREVSFCIFQTKDGRENMCGESSAESSIAAGINSSFVERSSAAEVAKSKSATTDEPLTIELIIEAVRQQRESTAGQFAIDASEESPHEHFTTAVRHPSASVLEYLVVDTNALMDSLPLVRAIVTGELVVDRLQVLVLVPLVVVNELERLLRGRRLDMGQVGRPRSTRTSCSAPCKRATLSTSSPTRRARRRAGRRRAALLPSVCS